MRAERARIHLVHARELLHVDHEYTATQDVLQAGARGFENRGDVLQDLRGLRFDVVASQPTGRRVASGLTRHENQTFIHDAGRIRAWGRWKIGAGDGLDLCGHGVIRIEIRMTFSAPRIAVLLLLLQPPADAVRDALNLGQTHADRLFAAFNRGYELTPSGTIDSAEIITEFRREVLIVRKH